MFPLALLKSGENAIIEIVKDDKHGRNRSESHYCKRVKEMGLRRGKEIHVLRNDKSNGLLVKVDNSRIVMDSGMAMKVMVRRGS